MSKGHASAFYTVSQQHVTSVPPVNHNQVNHNQGAAAASILNTGTSVFSCVVN